MGSFDSAVLPSFVDDDEEETVTEVKPVIPNVKETPEELTTGGFSGAVLPPSNMNNVLSNIKDTTKIVQEENQVEPVPVGAGSDGAILPSLDNMPEEPITNQIPNPELDEDVLYENEKYSDMVFYPLNDTDFENNTLPTIKNSYLENVKAELERDETNTFLQKEVNKEIIIDKRLKDKYKVSYKDYFSPERVADIRRNAEIQYNERQKLLKKFEPLAKAGGFESVTAWAENLAKTNPERYGTYLEDAGYEGFALPKVAESKQEFLNLAVQRQEERLQNQLLKTYSYLNSQNPATRKSIQILIDSELSLGAINAITEGKEWVDPRQWLGDLQVDASRFSREWKEGVAKPFHDIISEGNFNTLKEAWNNGDHTDLAAAAAFTVLDIAALGEVGKAIGKGAKKAKGWMAADYQTRTARANSARREQAIRDAVKKKVKENAAVKKEFLEQFEAKFDVKLTKMEDGELVIDRDAVKLLGERKTLDLMQSETGAVINLPSNALTAPILNAETFDGLIGTLIDLKQVAPEEFGKGATLIDDMLRVTIEGKVKPEKMMDILADNGMMLEEMVLATFGSVSKAGEVLGRFSHLKRAKPKGVTEDLDTRIAEKADNKIKDYYTRYFLRTENLRKGLLVAPLAVAARNQQSNFIRAPLESLNAIISNAVWRFSNEGATSALKSLSPFSERSSFKGGMDNMKLMFNDVREAKHFSEYLLQHSPDHARQMYNTLNEMQLNLGRGQATSTAGRVADQMYSDLEDFSAFINTPNRIQELNIRNATFWSEIQRLVRNEYKIDLKESLDNGMLMDFVRDASTVKPEGARSFIALMDDATRKAMRVTYSGVPENYILRKSAEFISKSPVSIAIPFPKFIANGIEYFAEGTMGAVDPIKRKIQAKFFDRSLKGPLTARESEKIANNIIGLGIFTGLYYWQRDENRGKDYRKVGIPLTDLDANILGTYPMAQMNWIVRAAVENDNGTFDQWDAKDDWLELFFGMQQRAGVSNVITDEFTSLMSGVADETDEAKRDRVFGRLLGQYLTTFVNPYFQVIEMERDIGFRTTERKEAGRDFIITENQFLNETERAMLQRGGIDPNEEALLPKRETVTDTQEKRQYIKSRIFAGVSVEERNEVIDYLQEIGITEPNFTLGSRHKMYSVRNYQDEQVSRYLPNFASQARRAGERAELKWQKSKELQDKYTLAAYMRMYERGYIMDQVRKRRELIGEGRALIDKPIAKRTDQYIRLPKDVRRVAEAEWTRLYSRKAKDGVIDFSNLKHLNQLLALAGVDLKAK